MEECAKPHSSMGHVCHFGRVCTNGAVFVAVLGFSADLATPVVPWTALGAS